jgi:hypothetical protein
MDASAVAVLLFLCLIVATLTAMNYLDVYRRKCIELEALRTALDYQYPKSIISYSLEGQEEMWREKDEQLAAQTEKLHQRFVAARSRLDERWRLNPLRDSLLNRRVFEYEVAKNRFLAAEENGPLQISVGMMPDFMKAGEPL